MRSFLSAQFLLSSNLRLERSGISNYRLSQEEIRLLQNLEMKMTDPKTKSIGTISPDKAKRISGFAEYAKAAAALTEARHQTTTAKSKVKDALKKQLGD